MAALSAVATVRRPLRERAPRAEIADERGLSPERRRRRVACGSGRGATAAVEWALDRGLDDLWGAVGPGCHASHGDVLRAGRAASVLVHTDDLRYRSCSGSLAVGPLRIPLTRPLAPHASCLHRCRRPVPAPSRSVPLGSVRTLRRPRHDG